MDLNDFGALQLKVLEMLWARGEATAGDLWEDWPSKHGSSKSRPAYTTVLSVLQKLHKKKLARRRKEGRAHAYSAAVNPDAFRRLYLAEVRRRVFGGNAAGLVAALVDDEEISKEDLEEIERLLARRPRKP